MAPLLDALFLKSLKGNRTKIAGVVGVVVALGANMGWIAPDMKDVIYSVLGPWAAVVAFDHGK